MTFDAKQFVLSHLVWVGIVATALVMGRSYLAERDARLLADAAVKTAQQNVKDLQSQIVAVNAAAAQKVQVVTKVVHDVQTTPQAIAAIPEVTSAPLNPQPAPNPAQVSVDALPLVQALAQCKIDAVQLQACEDTSQKKDEIIKQQDTEIVALKKKPGFWKRVTGTLKVVGVGIGIGVVLGAHGL